MMDTFLLSSSSPDRHYSKRKAWIDEERMDALWGRGD